MKGLQWLIRLVLSALITSAVCIASTFWAVSTYADMLLEQYNLKSAVSAAPNWSQFVGQMSKQMTGFLGQSTVAPSQRKVASTTPQSGTPADVPTAGSIDSSTSTSPIIPNSTGTTEQTDGNSSGNSSSTTNGSGTTTKKPPEDAIAVFGHQSSQTQNDKSNSGVSGVEDNKKIVVSGEEFTKKKEQLSNDEKNKIFNMLVTRVPQNEMQTISSLMEDGITAGELKQIEKILQQYLKPDEYAQLLAMIKVDN
ncbi:hypothetical protein [Paenibacillus sp. UNC451MF]|uniref:hypothetical protein n=1 Tax=Paenibacillus sp. UNC451MF TaxID=1449063 RepID=UPI00048A7677|nr:hypothetical protein [Paenibacillus sp. UNC451MF]